MKLSVYVLAREVAVLESAGDFKSELIYLPNTAADDFVSLTMPVRTDPWVWEDQLPAIFQMNLPEGYKQIQKRSIREGVLTGDQLAI